MSRTITLLAWLIAACSASAANVAGTALIAGAGSRKATTELTALPGLSRIVFAPITPEASDAAIRAAVVPATVNAHLDARSFQKADALLPPSIVELARALRNDVDLIHEFVRNNVDYYPVWGVQKGAVGTLLDRQGTAFDQALLMVALLRQAGHTANFVKGRIELTGADVGSWLGVSTANACAVQDLLAAGRIPVAQLTSVDGGCTALSTATLDHVWVKVNIGGTNFMFDPSFKGHVIKSGINLAAATGYSAATYLASAKTGATQTSDYIQAVNRNNIRANLTTLATNLATHVRTSLPAGELADLVGGTSIVASFGSALRQATLPYQDMSVAVDEFNDIPDTFRVTLRVQYAGIDQTFTSDALAGKRLTITYDDSNRPVLSLDGSVVATGPSALAPGHVDPVTFEIKHNAYGVSAADRIFTQSVNAGGQYLIGNSWGPSTRGPVGLHATRLQNAVAAGSSPTSEEVMGSVLAILSTTWLAQSNWSFRILDRLGTTTTTYHHQVGIVGHDRAGYVDLPGNLVAITSQTGSIANEDATFFAQAMHGSIFESTAVEQSTGFGAVSTIRLLDLANAAGQKIFDARSANYAGGVAPFLQGCSPSRLSGFASSVSAGRRLILPEHCDLTQNQWTGVGYLDISADLGSIGLLIGGNLAGGFGDQPVSSLIMMGNTLTVVQNPNQRVELRGPTISEPIDLASGQHLYVRSDLSAGIGDYPQRLTFDRVYASNRRTTDGPLGKGWSHNFASNIAIGSDGLRGMGEELALDAVGTVAEMMVSMDLLSDPAKPLDKLVVAAIGQRWFGDQLLRNTVTVTQALEAEVFVRLADGTYSAPPGKASKLILNGDNTFTVESSQKVRRNFDAAGRLSTHIFPNGQQVNLTYAGNDLAQVANSFGRSLAFTYSNGRLASVTDGARSVGYGYDGNANLTSFIDPLSKTTAYEYDVPGRMTRYFMPSFPAQPVITNVYDSLERVMTQADANGKMWTFFFAGSRIEQIAPDSTSIVTYHDGRGKVIRSTDALGRTIVNTYDGQSRLVKTVRPEGNGIEIEYDDAPCAAQKRCTHHPKTVRTVPKPGSGLPNLTTSSTYEVAFNRIATFTDARGNVTDFTYNAQGDPLQIQRPPDANGNRPTGSYAYSSFAPGGAFPPFTLPTGSTLLFAPGDAANTTITYDSANHYAPMTKVNDAGAGKLNLAWGLTFDAIGNLTHIDGPRSDVTDVVSFSYDAARQVTQMTDAAGRATRFALDADGRRIRVSRQVGANWMTHCHGFGATGKIVESIGPSLTASDAFCPANTAPVPVLLHSYDDLDRLKQTTQRLTNAQGGDRTTQLAYTADGRLLSIRNAAGNALAQLERTFSYTPNGMVASVVDAKNNRIDYAYDGFDRRVKMFFPSKSTPGVSSATDFEQYGYDANGNMTSGRKRDGTTVTHGYDNLDRLVSRTYPSAADNVAYTYDLANRPLSAKYQNGSHEVVNAWDHRDRVISATTGGRTITYQYDAAGNRIRTTWPDATPFYVTTDYDLLNRPTAIREMGVTLLAAYGYDDLSRRASITYGNGTSTTYTYDAQDKLATISHDLAGTAKDVTFSFSRNQAQEIINRATTNPAYDWDGTVGGTTPYAPNGLNQYTSVGASPFSYDASGNLTSTGVWSYSYDADNRLKTANGPVNAQLGWDALGRLRQSTINGATSQMLFDQSRLIGEYDGSGNVVRRFVHGPELQDPLVMYDGAGASNRAWLYRDHQSSVVATGDGAGNGSGTYTYGPFGETGATAPPRFGYTGHPYLAGLDLYQAPARTLSPSLGRFLQTDPIGIYAGMNLYAYVLNDPVNYYDPSGLYTLQIGLSVSGQGGVAASSSVGIIIDHHGNVGLYGSVGGGVSIGLSAEGGGSVQFSDGDTIWDVSGAGKGSSLGAGLGVGVTLDRFVGKGMQNQDVDGFGFTAGLKAGGGAGYGVSWTMVCGLFGDRKCAGTPGELGQYLEDAVRARLLSVKEALASSEWWNEMVREEQAAWREIKKRKVYQYQ